MAKKDGKRVSDIVNSALLMFLKNGNNENDGSGLDDRDLDTFVLRNDGEITLSKNDVVGIEREVGSFSIENTGHLIFDKDIDKESLKSIENIVIRDGIIEVPRNIYPQVLLRSEIHGKLWKY